MDRHLIKALIDAFAASSLAELEYTTADSTLRLVRGAGSAAPASMVASAAVPPPASPVMETADVVAPLYGVVHLQRSPGDPALVAVGQAVAAGQTVCLIEAMKVFTELRAERSGVVAAVLVASGQEVEAGQPLLRLA